MLDPCPTIRELVTGINSGRPVSELARAFHGTVAEMLTKAAHDTAKRTGLSRVVLSGGCFANQLLVEQVTDRLSASGHEVFVQRQVPTTDGGLALGQAVIAAARSRRRMGCA